MDLKWWPKEPSTEEDRCCGLPAWAERYLSNVNESLVKGYSYENRISEFHLFGRIELGGAVRLRSEYPSAARAAGHELPGDRRIGSDSRSRQRAQSRRGSRRGSRPRRSG